MSGLFAALVASATGRGAALTPPPRARFAAEEPFVRDDEPAEWQGEDRPEPARIGALDSRRDTGKHRPAAARGDQSEQPDRRGTPDRSAPRAAANRRDGETAPHGERLAPRAQPLLPPQERQPSLASGEAPEDTSRRGVPPAADEPPPIASRATLLPLVAESRPPHAREEPRALRPEASRPIAADNPVSEIRIGRIEVMPPAPSAAAKAAPARAQRPSRAPVRSSLDDYLSRGRR